MPTDHTPTLEAAIQLLKEGHCALTDIALNLYEFTKHFEADDSEAMQRAVDMAGAFMSGVYAGQLWLGGTLSRQLEKEGPLAGINKPSMPLHIIEAASQFDSHFPECETMIGGALH